MLDLLLNESPTDTQVSESLNGFVHRVERFLCRIGVEEFEFDEERLILAHRHSMSMLHRYINPSCFKAAAALTIGISSSRPFTAELPHAYTALNFCPNAVFSLLECCYWLHGAELRVAPDDVRTLTEAIEFSDHFFKEMVLSISKIGAEIDPGNHIIPEKDHAEFRILALVFEALAYQKNHHCKYPPPTKLQLDKYFSILT